MADGIMGIVERRMANTGESYAVALLHVVSKLAEIERDTTAAAEDTSWFEDWTKADHGDPRPELRAFLAGTGPRGREVAVRFPPYALVVAKRPLGVPRKGTVGFIWSFVEPPAEPVQVSVRQSPSAGFAGYCLPEDLEVVGFRGSITSDLMRELVDEIEGRR